MTSLNTTVQLNGWWGQESALLVPSSYLYLMKINLIKRLIEKCYMHELDNDLRNQTPYIKLCDKNRNPQDQSCYNVINNQPVTISMGSIFIHRNHIELYIGDNTYMTLVFKTNISCNTPELQTIIQSVIDDLYKLGN